MPTMREVKKYCPYYGGASSAAAPKSAWSPPTPSHRACFDGRVRAEGGGGRLREGGAQGAAGGPQGHPQAMSAPERLPSVLLYKHSLRLCQAGRWYC